MTSRDRAIPGRLGPGRAAASLILRAGAVTLALAGAAAAQVVAPGGGAPPASAAGQETPRQPGVARTTFAGRLVEAKDDRLSFSIPNQKQQKILRLPPELVAHLGNQGGRSFETTIFERGLPSGLAAAVSLRDTQGLYAIAESILDRPLLGQADRSGIQVELLPSAGTTLVYQTSCETAYNVPTVFVVGGQRHVLRSGESRDIEIGGTSYRLVLETSRFVVPKTCPMVFEGPRQKIDYALVRN